VRAYVLVTGTLFGLLVIVHAWRLTQERQLVRDPWWYLITGVAAALCVWAYRVLWLARRRRAEPAA
jgi:uncharacterized membrane protein YdcZ (DUF606 family)